MLCADQRHLMPAGGEALSDRFYVHLRTAPLGIAGVAPVEESHAK